MLPIVSPPAHSLLMGMKDESRRNSTIAGTRILVAVESLDMSNPGLWAIGLRLLSLPCDRGGRAR
jgi:hypothetical protein